MNKTLKVLLAVVLFAVVLMLATGVNAATLEKLVEDGILDEGVPAVAGNKVIYTISADVTDTIDLVAGENVEINIATGKSVAKITVPANATLTLNGEGTATEVENKGNVVVLKGTVGEVKNFGTLTIDAGTVTKLTISGDKSVVVSTPALPTGNNLVFPTKAIEEAMGTYETTKPSVKNLIVPAIKATVKVVDGTGAEVTKLVADDTYTIEVVATYTIDGDEYTVDTTDAEIKKVSLSEKDYNDYFTSANNNGVITFSVKKEIVDTKFDITVELDEKEYTVTLNGEATPENPDDENKDPEVPGDENKDPEVPGDENKDPEVPGDENNGEDNKNDNELDPDTPNTGDHIIPATALLAVVVVANVVYFAKMKRN